jgi:hypothetical protein
MFNSVSSTLNCSGDEHGCIYNNWFCLIESLQGYNIIAFVLYQNYTYEFLLMYVLCTFYMQEAHHRVLDNLMFDNGKQGELIE